MGKINRKILNPDIRRVIVYDEEDRRKNSRGHDVILKSSISIDKSIYRAVQRITGDAEQWIQKQYLFIKRKKLAKRAGYSRVIQRKAISLLVQYIVDQ